MQMKPATVEERTNAFGSAVERAEYADGTTVECTFDFDARLRGVLVEGVWGSQVMELWPDGSRSLAWATAGLRGSRRWDSAGGCTVSVEVAPRRLGPGGRAT